jgi:hypothetical protein
LNKIKFSCYYSYWRSGEIAEKRSFYEELKRLATTSLWKGMNCILFLKLNNLNVLIVGGGNVGLE